MIPLNDFLSKIFLAFSRHSLQRFVQDRQAKRRTGLPHNKLRATLSKATCRIASHTFLYAVVRPRALT